MFSSSKVPLGISMLSSHLLALTLHIIIVLLLTLDLWNAVLINSVLEIFIFAMIRRTICDVKSLYDLS